MGTGEGGGMRLCKRRHRVENVFNFYALNSLQVNDIEYTDEKCNFHCFLIPQLLVLQSSKVAYDIYIDQYLISSNLQRH